MSRPPRIAGFSYRGLHRYFLTICTLNRQKFFEDSSTVFDALLQFRRTAAEESFEISAYCFMPDHTHFLIEALADGSDFKRFCKLAKQRSGSRHARKNEGRLWQEGYHDRVLREGDDSLTVARYLINNPVRAGLVTSPIEYPYLGSDRWTLPELIEAQQ
jgi:putative transposase